MGCALGTDAAIWTASNTSKRLAIMDAQEIKINTLHDLIEVTKEYVKSIRPDDELIGFSIEFSSGASMDIRLKRRERRKKGDGKPYRRKRTRNRSRFDQLVYFIQESASGSIKIGISVDPKSRMYTLRTGSASPLILLGTINGGIDMEIRLHKRFKENRVNGEWFSASIFGEVMEILKEHDIGELAYEQG